MLCNGVMQYGLFVCEASSLACSVDFTINFFGMIAYQRLINPFCFR